MLERDRLRTERRLRHVRQQRGLACVVAAYVIYLLADAVVNRMAVADREWQWAWLMLMMLAVATALGLFLYGVSSLYGDGRAGRPRIV